MRAPSLVLTAVLVLTTLPALAQVVIDVEGQKATGPMAQEEAQPQNGPQPQNETQSPSKAQDQPPAKADDASKEQLSDKRYSFTRVDNGFLRLDSTSGQVAYCRPQTIGWSCEIVPENRASLEAEIARLREDVTSLGKLKAEIARLQEQVASLEKEIASLKEPPPPRPPADLSPPDRSDLMIKLPTQQDIDRARDFMANTWKRLVEMITAIQKDVMQKG